MVLKHPGSVVHNRARLELQAVDGDHGNLHCRSEMRQWQEEADPAAGRQQAGSGAEGNTRQPQAVAAAAPASEVSDACAEAATDDDATEDEHLAGPVGGREARARAAAAVAVASALAAAASPPPGQAASDGAAGRPRRAAAGRTASHMVEEIPEPSSSDEDARAPRGRKRRQSGEGSLQGGTMRLRPAPCLCSPCDAGRARQPSDG